MPDTEQKYEIRSPFAIGSEVDLGNQLKGVVLEINIRPHDEMYRVVWWDGKQRRTEWLDSIEVQAMDTSERWTIGFKVPDES